MTAAAGERDYIISIASVRTVDLTLPAYYKSIRIGSGHTPSGASLEVDNFGNLFISYVYGGSGSFDNTFFDSYGAIARSVRNREAFVGRAENVVGVTGSQTHGIRGHNLTTGTSGLVGVANGYDFYADGSGTNYGPFTGTHDALIFPADLAGAQLGDIVVDAECVYRRDVSNTLFRVTLSELGIRRSALGVICAVKEWNDEHLIAALLENGKPCGQYEELKAVGYKILAVNALGEGQINVCGWNGDIEQDDLIVISPVRGKGMRQDDDIIRSYTVARAREACKFTNKTDVKTIACIYSSG